MAKVLDAVVRFRKVEEATTPKDEPAPVYLLDEILEIARQSPEAAQSIAENVNKKLGHKSPVVKFKALRLIKHLCSKGCAQFQRCMQRYSTSVRELIHYKGEPDPFKGDVPNARVREFAKEVVEVMFNAAPVQSNTNTLAAQGKIQGFGSAGAAPDTGRSQYGGIGSGGSGRASSSAAPLGNIGVPLHGLDGPIMQGITNAASAIGDFLNKGTGTRSSLNQDAGRWDSPPTRAGASSYGARSNFEPPSYTPHTRTGSGGYGGSGSFGSGGGYGSSSGVVGSSGFGGGAGAALPVSASQVLGSEEAAVDDICMPGGLRPLPAAEDLRRFVETCSNLDGLRIAELLRAKMEGGNWQMLLRALAALEAVLLRGSSQACGEVAVMFQSDPETIRTALQSPHAPVRERSAAVLKLLLGEEVAVAPAQGSGRKGVARAAAPAVGDLLGDDEPAAGRSAAPTAAAAGGMDLLGGLGEPVPSSAAPAAAAAAAAAAAGAAGGADPFFSGLDVPVASAAAAPQPGDLFGGLDLGSGLGGQEPASVAGAPAPAAGVGAPALAHGSPSRSVPLDDLFAGLGTSDQAGPARSQAPQQQQHHQMGVLPGFAGAGVAQGGALQGMQQPLHHIRQPQAAPLQHSAMGVPGSMPGAGPFSSTLPQQAPGGIGYGVPQQQQQQQQHMQQLPGGYGNGAMVGGAPSNSGSGYPGLMQQQAPGSMQFGAVPQQQGFGGMGLAGQQQPQPGWGGAPLAPSGGSGNAKAWAGRDDVSNLMRHVASGGKHDPAFDFVSAEFSKRKA